MVSAILGGVGLFLVGMVLVTDGLRDAAGDSLRRVLLRFTGGPFKALLSGTALTAVIQSSSATTLATIGFVGAGLITFPQALGVIYGASLGTTATSWIVALLGLKLSMSVVALPVVGLGALLRLFLRGRPAHVGMALAGFGILFVGIDVLQEGMRGLAEGMQATAFPGGTVGGRLLMVGLGIVMTVLMQSSSAAIATTLAALHAGTVTLDQAAALAIGATVGTTVTAGLAVIGASVAARRTALGHFVFNVLAAGIGLASLPLFVAVATGEGRPDPTILLAAFHTAFNLAGVVIVLPLTRQFAAFISRLLPERGPPLTRFLDPAAASSRPIAMEAVRRTVFDITGATFRTLRSMLRTRRLLRIDAEAIEAARLAIAETNRYLADLPAGMGSASRAEQERSVSTVHALEHLERLIGVCNDRHLPVLHRPVVAQVARILEAGIDALLAWVEDPSRPAPVDALHACSLEIAGLRRAQRPALLLDAARGERPPAEALSALDATRWLDRVGYGAWRIADHLQGDRLREP